jgi:hypothetical protein
MDVVGVHSERCTTFGGVITPPVRLPEDVMPKYDCSRCSILIGPTNSAAPTEGVAAERNRLKLFREFGHVYGRGQV